MSKAKVYQGFGKAYKSQNADHGFNIKGLRIAKKPFDVDIFESSRGLISAFQCDGHDFAMSVGKWKPTAPASFATVKGEDLTLTPEGHVFSTDGKNILIEKV